MLIPLHQPYRLAGNLSRGIGRLGRQPTPAGASPERRDKKFGLGIYGGGCDAFGAGARAIDLKRERLVHCSRRPGDRDVGANSPA